MDKQRQGIPAREGASERKRKGEEQRRRLDEVPEPGTDPLHEGP